MKKSLVVAIAMGALALGTIAFAQTSTTDIMSLMTSGVQSLVPAVDPALSLGVGNSSAVNGANSFAGAVADRDGIAVNGAFNLALDADITVALDNVGNLNQANDDEAVAVMGNGNQTQVDNTTVRGDIGFYELLIGVPGAVAADSVGTDCIGLEPSNGVVAVNAAVECAFNTVEVVQDVEVQIANSFNVYNSALDISGQDGATAIVSANTAGEQLAGADLNVTNAAASVPTLSTGVVVPVISGNALALTVTSQTVVNSAIVLGLAGQLAF